MIDGGRRGVYKSASGRGSRRSARTALAATRRWRSTSCMVSHIDDDHIHGITDLTKELVEAADSPGDPPVEIANLWHNAFDDVVGDDEVQAIAPAAVAAALEAGAGAPGGMSLESTLVLAKRGPGRPAPAGAER